MARRIKWLSAAGAVLAVAALIVVLAWPDHPRHSYTAAPVSAPAPPAVRPAAVTRKPHRVVPSKPVAPTDFVFTGPKFTIRANMCRMANIRPYDPPGDEHSTVCYVGDGFGGPPGNPSVTTYLFAHAWAPDPNEVLNKASALATREFLRAHAVTVPSVKPTAEFAPWHTRTPVYPVRGLNGYRIVLKADHAVLTYQVRSAYGVRKDYLGDIEAWENPHNPNRLVLTTCAELDGVDYDYNVVIYARLVSRVSR